MTTETVASEAIQAREHLRTFHLTGPAPGDEILEGTLRPAILNQFADLPCLETFYPIRLNPDGSALPSDAFQAAYHADSLVLLHAAALAQARRAQRTRFWEEVRSTAARLREMLVLDKTHLPGAISAETVTASLGSRAGEFFNPALLAKALDRPANPLRCMEPERRSRCETTVAMLQEACHDAANDPEFFLFQAGAVSSDVALFRGAAKQSADSFAAALNLSDARLDGLTLLLRALRVARLEIGSAFNPAIHEEMLSRFDWQSATAEELLAIPPIVVLETADRLAQASLTSFGRLLRSGRPVQILIARPGLDPQDISGFSPDLGYLSIAHRESFVLQSSMAQPSHLLPGLAAMARTQRPAVAVVSVAGAWLADCLLVLSRTIPLYTYDPDAGSRWAERFRLFIPPPADLSSAHAAAMAIGLQGHFRVIPASAWNDEQLELAEYQAAYKTGPPLAIPYIWLEGPNGDRQRALLTRDLANFCIDRRRAWDLFEELSATGNPEPAPNDNAREEGAKEALQKVIAMLTTTP